MPYAPPSLKLPPPVEFPVFTAPEGFDLELPECQDTERTLKLPEVE